MQASFNIISENMIINNKVRIYTYTSSTENYIYNNIFIGNTEFNALDDGISNFWDNGIIGNYWDDYTGVD
ncbi:MAG: NosD domain-containing protein [Promethearchaeota archaeon]